MDATTLRYDQIDPAIEARVDGLLAGMSLAEKIGQLVQVTPFLIPGSGDPPAQTAPAGETNQAPQAVPRPRPGLADEIRAGRIGSIFGTADVRQINALQRLAVEESRLGIPLIVGNDVIHGFRTIFPIPLAESCTWDPPLVQQAARAAAEEAAACGTDWIFAPVVDVARDPRWGRVAEGAGEDTYLTMVMARARVRGFQAGDLLSARRIVACPKHYVAYGAVEAGRDYNTVDISERTLREVYLPPFKAAFDAGAGSVMTSFNDIGGVPSTSNAFALRTVLRDEWQWPGLVVSDYEAVRELVLHGVASDLKEAARLSIRAGVDMDMMSNAYARHLAALVDEGAVAADLVDEAARRVLRLKVRLGLFERPYSDEALADQVILRADFRALALQVAQESMVLVKNDGRLLPLSAEAQRIAVIGPLAGARRDLLGTWVVFGQATDADTVLEGMSAYRPGLSGVTYVQGCPIEGDDPLDIPAAVAAAAAADVVVVVLGEGWNMSGEARSRAHLGLPGRQQELLDALAATGTPIAAVLMTGRPLVIPRLTEQAGALLIAWHGGIRAGRAIADILFGAVSPSGKLTASWPRTEGQIPVYYAHKMTGRPIDSAGTTQFSEPFTSRYMDEPNDPLFVFGHGLSYTTFGYRDLRVETPVVDGTGTLVVSAVIENTGGRAAAEVAQLYVRDVVGSVTRLVKELKGFQRITLQPGEERTIRFEIPVAELSCIGADMRSVVEPGLFAIWIGPDAATGLEGEFEVR